MNLRNGRAQTLTTQLFRDNLITGSYSNDLVSNHVINFNDKNSAMHWWGQQYTLCALVELQELDDSDSEQNDIIEIIDVWHFLLSMFQVMGIQYEDLIRMLPGDGEDLEELFYWNEPQIAPGNDEYQQEVIQHLRTDLFKVLTLFPWKHWSKKSDFNHAEIIDAMYAVLGSWVDVATCWEITPARLYEIYLKKNAVNIYRQNSGTYSEATKDESDNQSIDVGVAG